LSSLLPYRNVKVKIYKTIILPVVLHGCETWSLTLREEHRLRVFGNRVLRRITKRDEVRGEWSKMFRAVFWVVLPCKMIADRRFIGAYCRTHLSNVGRQSFYTAVQPRRQP
jgi:hypothetical protein